MNRKLIFKFLSVFTLIISMNFSYAAITQPTVKNVSLDDSRVPKRFLPIEKMQDNQTMQYHFVDKSSVSNHPFNPLIRGFNRLINFVPALTVDVDGEKQVYHSAVIKEFVNCHKKEHVKTMIQNYEGFFGEGKIINVDSSLKRWAAADKGSKDMQSIIVVCSLPLIEVAQN